MPRFSSKTKEINDEIWYYANIVKAKFAKLSQLKPTDVYFVPK